MNSPVGRSVFRVRYAETDQMGVVHHGSYIVWCEIGRTDLMREIGVRYAELEAAGVFLPVAELNIRYRSSARYDELIEVVTRVVRVQSRAVTFHYEIRRHDDGASLAEAETTLVAMNASGSARTLPADILARFREFEIAS